MCGNSVNLYSNPDILDSMGQPMGDPETANMARVWRERARDIAGHRQPVIPVRITTDKMIKAEDGLCSLAEVLANSHARRQEWLDCAYNKKTRVTFDLSVLGTTFYMENMPPLAGDLELDCEAKKIQLTAAGKKTVIRVAEEGRLVIKNCDIRGHPGREADAIENRGTLGLLGCSVSSALNGVYNKGTLIVDKTLIERNLYGIFSEGGSLTIRDSHVRSNTVDGLYGRYAEKGSFFISGSTIGKNGGGVFFTEPLTRFC